jgi:hypothetical protein
MLRRTAEWNRLLKGLAVAFMLISSSVAPAVGEEAPDAFDSQAAKGPDPRKELRAEAALPGVDPADARRIGKPDMTLLADPAPSPVGNTVAIPAGNEQVLIGSLKTELDATKAELAKTKEIVGEVIKEYKQIAESRELPPLKDAEVRVFQLKNTKAAAAAQKVELLFGSQPLRIAVDEPSNGLIVFGKAEAIPQVEQLIIKLDELAATGTAEYVDVLVDRNVVTAPAAARRTLLLRVFWLANGVEGLDSADGYLPAPVINSLVKLGLSDPRLVTQTVNSLSVEEGGSPVEFSTNVPAILFEQPVTLTCAGTMGATTDNRADVDMQLTVGGIGVNCDLKGSLATPLGHFMVLGTANSVIPEHQAMMVPAEGGMGMGMPMGRGGYGGRGGGETGMAMGRGGEMSTGREGGGMARGAEMGGAGFGDGMPIGNPPAKYNASRFAFVVQVIEAESFEPSEEGE